MIKDPVQAHAWFKLSSAGGNEDGKNALKKIESEMTPDQIAKATELARELESKIKKK